MLNTEIPHPALKLVPYNNSEKASLLLAENSILVLCTEKYHSFNIV